jgi:glycosyltransferase involved in cell wall biosynthesis
MTLPRSGGFRSLVVVPSDPIVAYEQAGLGDWLERYFNPNGVFKEVFALSPLEKGKRSAYGMTIIGVAEKDFEGTLRMLHPDVVRGYGGYWASDLVCSRRLSDIPVIVSVHDPNPRNIHKSVRYADLVICTSNIVAQRVIQRGTDPARVRILPNRVDRNVFHPIRDEKLLQPLIDRFPSGRHILHVGRKSKEKNLDTVIHMLPLLPDEYQCIFIGRGDAKPYQSLAQSLGVENRCFWIESVNNSELPLWLSWCDCMCTPSLWEGFGIVFIEAAACGAPIVTSDIAPMNEYLTRDVNACLVREYCDPKALATAVRRVCEDEAYRKSIIRGSLEAALQFDSRVIDLQEVAIYREAVSIDDLFFSRKALIAVWQTKHILLSSLKQTMRKIITQR